MSASYRGIYPDPQGGLGSGSGGHTPSEAASELGVTYFASTFLGCN